MRVPTLYTITGLPYSGKTTLKNKLASQCGFSVISIDEIMDEAEMWNDPHPTDEDWGKAYEVAYQRLEDLLRQGKSVVFDGGSLRKSERETQRSIAEKTNALYKLIYVNTRREIINQRRVRNQSTKEREDVDDLTMKTAFQIWEEPTIAENPIIYTQEVNFDKWFGENIRE